MGPAFMAGQSFSNGEVTGHVLRFQPPGEWCTVRYGGPLKYLRMCLVGKELWIPRGIMGVPAQSNCGPRRTRTAVSSLFFVTAVRGRLQLENGREDADGLSVQVIEGLNSMFSSFAFLLTRPRRAADASPR